MFKSIYRTHPGEITFPKYSSTRIMMMPVLIGSIDGIPENYVPLVHRLYENAELRHVGHVGYLTIDERNVSPRETLRRPGLHVDGYYKGGCGIWGGGSWGSVGNGMLIASNTDHCEAYFGMVEGTPGDEGECDHLNVDMCGKERLAPNTIHWLDGACVHESLPVERETRRQFVRLSLPNGGPWFVGYTKNPMGIQPSGEILTSRDEFMKYGDSNG